MMGEGEFRPAIGKCPHRLLWVHVLVAHEPARLIGADRQDGEAEWAVALARLAESQAVAVARIGHVINAAARRLHDEAHPQRLVAVEQAARRPVPQRDQGDRDIGGERDPLVPVESLRRDGGIVGAHHGVVAERGDHSRPVGGGQARQRRHIEVIVMAVRHQHRIDRRQGVERDAGVVDPLRPGEADRRGALRPYRIEQQVEPCGLDEEARMADKADPDRGAADPGGRVVRKRARRPFRPFLAASGGHPAQHVEGPFGGAPWGSWNRVPSKWSDTGPS
jgi:hypothetical protein